MALDTTKPADSNLLSELAAFIRANRVAINTNETSIAAGSALVYTILNVSGGATVMDIDTDVPHW
jgi:myosin-crossreactive antigen